MSREAGGMDRLLVDLREAQRTLSGRTRRAPQLTRHLDALARLEAIATARPRVIVLGEANAGKTSVANLLLAAAVLPDSVVANTRRPLVLHYAEAVGVTAVAGRETIALPIGQIATAPRLDRIDIGLPNPRLGAFDLMDTPGLSSSAQLDALNLCSSDMLIWCTVASQAWKDSERRLWMSAPERRRRDAVLVATHRDALRDQHDLRKVRARLAAETQDLFRAIVFVTAGGSIDRASDMLPDSGEGELAMTIENGLCAIRKRRHDAVYRVVCEIMREALTLLEHGPRRPLLRLARAAAPSLIPLRAT
jgi:hypothetical protein